jgi:uracil-DNA glycosylase
MPQMNSPYDENCQKCPYHNQAHLINTTYQTTRTPPVPVGLENNSSDILLVFQSPGTAEWKVGAPLQVTARSAGKRIENSWKRKRKQSSLQYPIRHDFDITNTVQCFQGKAKSGRDAKPKKMAIQCCSNRLMAILQKKNYSKIIAFGGIAQQVLPLLIRQLPQHPTIIRTTHPTGGTSNATLDTLW